MSRARPELTGGDSVSADRATDVTRPADSFVVEPRVARLAAMGAPTSSAVLDLSLVYLRYRAAPVLWHYAIGMLPHSLVVLWLTDAVSIRQRSAIPLGAAALTAASIWRWGWIAIAQHRIQEDLRGEKIRLPIARLPIVIAVRAMTNLLLTWGGFLIIPAYYGMLLSGMASPALLDRSDLAPGARINELFRQINRSWGRMLRILSIHLWVTMLITLSVFVGQTVIVEIVMPNLLGMPTQDLRLTVYSWTWTLSVFYFVFLVSDFLWLVIGVFAFHDMRAQRYGTDLRVRLRSLETPDTSDLEIGRKRGGVHRASENALGPPAAASVADTGGPR